MTSRSPLSWPIAADALTLERFGALDLRVDTKPDLTPVTDADRSAEELLRASLTEHRPDDSVFGEELGGTAAFTGRQWVHRPDRRHQELRPRRAGVVHADRAARRRRPGRRRRQRARAGAAVVGGRRRGRVHVVRRRDAAHLGLRRRRSRLGQPVVLRPDHRLG